MMILKRESLHKLKLIFYEDIHNSWLYCFTNPLELGLD